jgi:hypothetical protein
VAQVLPAGKKVIWAEYLYVDLVPHPAGKKVIWAEYVDLVPQVLLLERGVGDVDVTPLTSLRRLQ